MLSPLIATKWLSENFNNPNLIILDASPKENKSNLTAEFPDIQIKGARLFDMETIFYDKESSIPNMIPSPEVFEEECQKLGIHKNSLIVVYDNLGVYTSPRVWWMFKTMGHDAIAVLNGGLSAWKKEGFSCEPLKINSYKRGDFEPNYHPNLVCNAKQLLENIEIMKIQVIDARSEGRFSGTTPEPRENMSSGHIPNSVNLPFELVLSNGKMKSSEELTVIFQKYAIKNQPLAFTCGSGITACIILLASELIFKNVKMLYDGSWSEWGQTGKYPVQR